MRRRKDKDGTTVLEGGALTLKNAINIFHPVNSIIMTTDNVNPGTRLPGTTWIAWGAGRAVVGVGNNGSNTYTSEQTFGVDSVTLTAAQSGVNTHTHAHTLAAPAHTHPDTTATAGDHLHQPNVGDTSWGFHAYKQGGTVARRQAASGTSFYAISATTMADLDFSEATEQIGNHTHTINAGAASATALTGAMGAVSGAASPTSHENRQSSIATYLWKRTA